MKFFFAIILWMLVVTTGLAQNKVGPVNAADKKAIEATVKKLFDSMRVGDSAMARSVLAPNMRIIVVSASQNGQTMPRETSRQKFLETISTPRPQVMDERFWDGKLELDGDLASYWCQYAFFNGDKFSHCGVDVFQLYRSAQGWKIVNLAYNIKRENCDMAAIPAK